MSTRGLFSFVARSTEIYHVYKHHDCYPEGDYGGIAAIDKAQTFGYRLPRFEADEFAAAFVCAAKMPGWSLEAYKAVYEASEARGEGGPSEDRYGATMQPVQVAVPWFPHLQYGTGGEVRLLPSGRWQDVAPWDIEYRYIVFERRGRVLIECYRTGCNDAEERTQTRLFSGSLQDALAWAADLKREQDQERAAREAAELLARAPVPRIRTRSTRLRAL